MGKTAPSVFVLEFGDAHFGASVGEGSFPFGGNVETRDVADAWLLFRRIPGEIGHAADVASESFQTPVDIIGRPRSGGAVLQSFSQERFGSAGDGGASAQVVARRIEGIAIKFSGC